MYARRHPETEIPSPPLCVHNQKRAYTPRQSGGAGASPVCACVNAMSLASNEKIDQSAHCEAKLAEVRAAVDAGAGLEDPAVL